VLNQDELLSLKLQQVANCKTNNSLCTVCCSSDCIDTNTLNNNNIRIKLGLKIEYPFVNCKITHDGAIYRDYLTFWIYHALLVIVLYQMPTGMVLFWITREKFASDLSPCRDLVFLVGRRIKYSCMFVD
jgi:hypothetical protein